MNLSKLPYLMMVTGAVLALIFAAGPVAESLTIQVCFCASLLLLAAGAMERRLGAKKVALSGLKEGEVQQAQEALASLRVALQQSQANCSVLTDMPAFHRYVYDATQPPAKDFLKHRQSLLDAYGIGPFAELMIQFASVERAINRTLSASADGATEEARRCLLLANQRMGNCLLPNLKE